MSFRFVFLALVLSSSTSVMASTSVELMFGYPYNTKSPLHINQDGSSNIATRADFETEPFTPPFYYSMRLAKRTDNAAWELELLHHKLYLQNRPANVQRFDVSHGFNLLFVNRSWDIQPLILRIGLGAVVAHPENTVNNQPLADDGGLFGSGQYLAGATGQLSAGWSYAFHRHWFATLEGKLTYAYARLKIADGHANLLHGALHALGGIGYRW